MNLTTDQKRKFIKLIASGKADARFFKAIPERHFKRVSALPTQDEISLTATGEAQVNIMPDTVFKCRQDGKEYLYSQIKEMEGNVPFVNGFYGIADNEATAPAAIDEIEIMHVSINEQIKYFLNRI
jgi:hypothetical protein